MKKILLISGRVFPTSSQGVRYTNFAQHFSSHFEIVHLTFQSKLLALLFAENFQIGGASRIEMLRKFGRACNRISEMIFPDEYRLFLKMYFKICRALIEAKNIENVMIGMAPFSFMKLGKMLKERYPSINLICDLSDPFSANAEILRRKDRGVSIRREWELKYLKYFDHLVVLNSRIKEYYDSLLADSKTTVHVIEQGIDERFLKIDHISRREGSKIRLIYAGQFYESFRAPANVFQAVGRLKESVELDLYGSMKKKYRGEEFENINYRGWLKVAELISEIEKSDIILIVDNFYGVQVPGKTLECLASKKPILFIYNNKESPTLAYIHSAQGVRVCMNNQDEIVTALKYLVENHKKFHAEFDHSPYLWKNLIAKYAKMIIGETPK